MKKILSIIALCAVAALASMAQKNGGAKGVQVAGVAFYNLENLFDTIPNNPLGRDEEFTPAGSRQWDGRKYWAKINNLAHAISQMKTSTTPIGPAIIGVSEIENKSVLDDLVADPQIVAWNLQVVHHDSPDKRGVDVGLLYNPKYFKVLNVTNHTATRVKFATRDIMCVVGSLMGQKVAVMVNHWPSRLGGQEQSSPNREALAMHCVDIADSLWREDPSMGIIIMGDLNDDPMDKSVAKVLGAKRDAKGVGEHQFYNPWWKKLDDGIGTLAYKSQWNLFDQIIVSGNLTNAPEDRWHFQRADVLNKEFLRDTNGNRKGYPLRTYAAGSYLNGYSDHFPTEIFLVRTVERKK